MIYRRHHFIQNYFSATGANDKDLKKEMVINEIAKIIVARPDIAIGILGKAGIDIDHKSTEKEIAAAYEENIPKNKLLKRLLAMEIVEGNKISFDGNKYFNANKDGGGGGGMSSGARGTFSAPSGDGDSKSSGGGTDWGSLISGVVNVIGASVVSSKANKNQRKQQGAQAIQDFKDRTLTPLQDKVEGLRNQLASEYDRLTNGVKGKSNVKTVALVVLGVSAVVGIVWFTLSHLNKTTANVHTK